MDTILVADDNMLDNIIIRNYLYDQGFNIITAFNGREAFEMLESRNVDLIILDLVMPVMDGFEFLKLFSKTVFYSEVPIIVASSLSTAGDIEKTLQYDVYDYIIKPLDNIHKFILVNKIRKAIQHRKNIQELSRHGVKNI